jgi:septal ring-binding cell division protein DamX
MSLLALQDLFRRHREHATGLWKLGQEPGRTIYLESGDVVFASSTHLTDRLTYLLVERGKLTQGQMDYAMANLKPGLSIGKNLIEMGYITQRDLLDVARMQVERIVQGALETPDEEPAFQARELDASVVRLPMDTPRLLMTCLLELKDRERLLELLGPLNQVVVLQSKRIHDLALPPDLAKLPPLLDGTHTLLELSRESLAEPLRLGIFALFLREIGWARLHEMPPLDRQAIDRALSPESEPLSAMLPEKQASRPPSLFSTIEAASRPTTNLEHLSLALDEEPQFEPEPEPETEIETNGFSAESGQAVLPTPAVELPEIIEGAKASQDDPSVRIQPSTLESLDALPEAPEMPPIGSSKQKSSRLAPLLVGLLVGLVGLYGLWWWMNRPRNGQMATASPKSEPGIHDLPPVPKPSPLPVEPPVSETPQPEPPKPEPAKPEPAKPEPPPEKKPNKPLEVGTSIPERLEVLRRGDLELATKQGAKVVKEARRGQWSLRLEIACMGDTVRRALDVFSEGKPDLFLLPIKLRDGRTCYQVYYGRFPSESAAEKRAKDLPAIFREGGNHPRPFKLSDLPSKQ